MTFVQGQRLQGLRAALTALRSLLPEHFADVAASIGMFLVRLDVAPVLPTLRECVVEHGEGPAGFQEILNKERAAHSCAARVTA